MDADIIWVGRDWITVVSSSGVLLATGRRAIDGTMRMTQARGAWAGTVFFCSLDRVCELSALYAGVSP